MLDLLLNVQELLFYAPFLIGRGYDEMATPLKIIVRENGTAKSVGTAWIAQSQTGQCFAVTAFHVVGDQGSGEWWHEFADEVGYELQWWHEIESRVDYRCPDQTWKLTPCKRDVIHDVALLKVAEGSLEANVEAQSYFDPWPLPRDRFTAKGFAKAAAASGGRSLPIFTLTGSIDATTQERIQLRLDQWRDDLEGMSGAQVMDNGTGTVVGVLLSNPPNQRGQPTKTGYAAPIRTVVALLTEHVITLRKNLVLASLQVVCWVLFDPYSWSSYLMSHHELPSASSLAYIAARIEDRNSENKDTASRFLRSCFLGPLVIVSSIAWLYFLGISIVNVLTGQPFPDYQVIRNLLYVMAMVITTGLVLSVAVSVGAAVGAASMGIVGIVALAIEMALGCPHLRFTDGIVPGVMIGAAAASGVELMPIINLPTRKAGLNERMGASDFLSTAILAIFLVFFNALGFYMVTHFGGYYKAASTSILLGGSVGATLGGLLALLAWVRIRASSCARSGRDLRALLFSCVGLPFITASSLTWFTAWWNRGDSSIPNGIAIGILIGFVTGLAMTLLLWILDWESSDELPRRNMTLSACGTIIGGVVLFFFSDLYSHVPDHWKICVGLIGGGLLGYYGLNLLRHYVGTPQARAIDATVTITSHVAQSDARPNSRR
jgi:hypothetical protein